MRKYVIFCLIALLSSSCGHRKQDFDGLKLQVDLKEQVISVDDLFSKIEVIPLETQDSCLIMSIEKIFQYNNDYYICDQRKPAIYKFNKKGDFIDEIIHKGDGPGEYQIITDMLLDKDNIILLTPFGSLLIYDTNGRFMQQKNLPIKPNYYSIIPLHDNIWALWSCVDELESGITVINENSMNVIYETWHNDRILDMGLMSPFYQYNSNYYFSTAYKNIVYKIDKDSLQCAYSWNFGKDNIDSNQLLQYTKIKDAGERNSKIQKDLDDGKLPYTMENNNQNDKFYYLTLRKGTGFNRPWINVFYDKRNDKSFVFQKTKEGIHIRPVLFTDTYLISILSSEDIESYRNVIDENEYKKLEAYKADDNPCLVKFYFK